MVSIKLSTRTRFPAFRFPLFHEIWDGGRVEEGNQHAVAGWCILSVGLPASHFRTAHLTTKGFPSGSDDGWTVLAFRYQYLCSERNPLCLDWLAGCWADALWYGGGRYRKRSVLSMFLLWLQFDPIKASCLLWGFNFPHRIEEESIVPGA